MEQYCVNLTINITVPFTLEEEPAEDAVGEAMLVGMDDIIDQIKEVLSAAEVEDIEIIKKNVYKC